MITYVVSGVLKSGHSMMMHCLNLGGLNISYPLEEAGKYRIKYPDAPNPDIIDKVEQIEHRKTEPDPRPTDWDHIKGKCLRLLGVQCLDRGLTPMKVVYLRRNQKSQQTSEQAHFGGLHISSVPARIERVIKRLESRAEVDTLTVLDYDEILQDPVTEFQKLVDAGWPINIEAAVKGVMPELKHF